jgi:FAD/FMN-containing dehydrogenase
MGVAPAAKVFDVAFFEKVSPKDVRPTRTEGQDLYYWAGNQDEVSAYWYAYQSRWLPLDRFDAARRDELARAFFDASRSWTVALHFNKGLAGAPEEALARSRQTSVNPAVERAAALVIMAANGSDVHPGVKGYEPDVPTGEKERERVSAGMKIINAVAGDAGSYVNETDYFEPNWQHVFWGENYARLLELKKKYDPDGLFFCHHCVGSEMWSSDGMCKKSAL